MEAPSSLKGASDLSLDIRFNKLSGDETAGLPAELITMEDGIAVSRQARILKMTQKGAYLETAFRLEEGQRIGLIIRDIYEAILSALKLSARVNPAGNPRIKTSAVVSGVRIVTEDPFLCRAYVSFQGVMHVSHKGRR